MKLKGRRISKYGSSVKITKKPGPQASRPEKSFDDNLDKLKQSLTTLTIKDNYKPVRRKGTFKGGPILGKKKSPESGLMDIEMDRDGGYVNL